MRNVWLLARSPTETQWWRTMQKTAFFLWESSLNWPLSKLAVSFFLMLENKFFFSLGLISICFYITSCCSNLCSCLFLRGFSRVLTSWLGQGVGIVKKQMIEKKKNYYLDLFFRQDHTFLNLQKLIACYRTFYLWLTINTIISIYILRHYIDFCCFTNSKKKIYQFFFLEIEITFTKFSHELLHVNVAMN